MIISPHSIGMICLFLSSALFVVVLMMGFMTVIKFPPVKNNPYVNDKDEVDFLLWEDIDFGNEGNVN